MNKQLQEEFDGHFATYRYVPIAIYGTGVNAKLVLEHVQGYDFFSVIDREHVGEVFAGKPVLPLEKVVEKAGLIIIAAARRNIHIIYRRISPNLPDGLPVYSIQGMRLDGLDVYDNPYWKENLVRLERKIDDFQIISFDIFDTLLMRQTLYQVDVFDLVERELAEEGHSVPFTSWRLEAERSVGNYPTLEKIYSRLAELHSEWKQIWLDAQTKELRWERRLLVKRQEMVDAFHYALKRGKKVFLISDMYLPTSFVEKILAEQGVKGYERLLNSSEEQASKVDGTIYERLREKCLGESVMHIGDNDEFDVQRARQTGFTAYRVYSAYDLLAESRLSFLLETAHGLDDHMLLGRLASRLLNSPFALQKVPGRLYIENMAELGLAFAAGGAVCFLQFLARQVAGDKLAKILFVSRDGYFLQKVWEQLRSDGLDLPESIYFYSSRQAATGACVLEDRDVRVLLSDCADMQHLSLRHFLTQRFQIDFLEIPEELSCKAAVEKFGQDGLVKLVLRRKMDIFAAEERRRKGYQAYLERLGLVGRHIYIVDIMTRGTVAYALSRLTGQKVHLVSYGLVLYPNAYLPHKDLVASLFGVVGRFSSLEGIGGILEMVFASQEGQLAGFRIDGQPEFVPESSYASCVVTGMQAGLSDFLADYPDKKWIWHNVSKEMAAALMELLDTYRSEIAPEVSERFTFYNPLAVNPWYNQLKQIRGETDE